MKRPYPGLAALAAALALALATPKIATAGAQLFKCVEGGRTVYQQQACPLSSQPEGASAPRAAAKASGPAEPALAAARKIKPSSSTPPASAVPATRQ